MQFICCNFIFDFKPKFDNKIALLNVNFKKQRVRKGLNSYQMKNTLFILSLMLVFVSCKKEQVPTEKPDEYWFYNGTISITRNGKEWKPRLCAVYDNSATKASFHISIIDVREGFLWDEFGFYNIPCSNNNNIVEDYKIWLKSKDSAILKMPYALYNGSFNEGADAISVSNMRKDRPHYIFQCSNK